MVLSVYEAVRTGDHSKVIEALRGGEGVDTLGTSKDMMMNPSTALQWLVRNGNDETSLRILETLVKNGANLNIRNFRSATLLISMPQPASIPGHGHCIDINIKTRMMSQLIDYGADLDATDFFGTSVLINCVKWNWVEPLKMIIRRGANVNHTTQSALLLALDYKHVEISLFLIENGVTPYDRRFPTPAEYARSCALFEYADASDRAVEAYRLPRLNVLAHAIAADKRPSSEEEEENEEDFIHPANDNRQNEVNVYDLKTDTWKIIMGYVHKDLY